MLGKYILDGKKPVECEDTLQWGQWFETADRHVAEDYLDWNGKQIHVSTVFLGIDHNWNPDGQPVLFETMIFGFPEGHRLDEYQRRNTTWERAEEAHQHALNLVKSELECSGK